MYFMCAPTNTHNSLVPSFSTTVRYEFSGFPVVNDIEHLLIIGYITRKNLQLALRKGLRDPSLGPQSEVVFSDTSKVHPKVSLHFWIPRTGGLQVAQFFA